MKLATFFIGIWGAVSFLIFRFSDGAVGHERGRRHPVAAIVSLGITALVGFLMLDGLDQVSERRCNVPLRSLVSTQMIECDLIFFETGPFAINMSWLLPNGGNGPPRDEPATDKAARAMTDTADNIVQSLSAIEVDDPSAGEIDIMPEVVTGEPATTLESIPARQTAVNTNQWQVVSAGRTNHVETLSAYNRRTIFFDCVNGVPSLGARWINADDAPLNIGEGDPRYLRVVITFRSGSRWVLTGLGVGSRDGAVMMTDADQLLAVRNILDRLLTESETAAVTIEGRVHYPSLYGGGLPQVVRNASDRLSCLG